MDVNEALRLFDMEYYKVSTKKLGEAVYCLASKVAQVMDAYDIRKLSACSLCYRSYRNPTRSSRPGLLYWDGFGSDVRDLIYKGAGTPTKQCKAYTRLKGRNGEPDTNIYRPTLRDQLRFAARFPRILKLLQEAVAKKQLQIGRSIATLQEGLDDPRLQTQLTSTKTRGRAKLSTKPAQ